MLQYVSSESLSYELLAPLWNGIGPRLRRDDPLNLSILISGGKEINRDSLSKGD